MSNQFLVILEVSQKQNYVFKSNQLKQNVGASMIVRYVTEKIGDSYCTEEERFFTGGGKGAYLFITKEKATDFIRKVSTEALIRFPGIELFAAIQEFNWEEDKLPDVMFNCFAKLNKKKAARKESYRLYNLGIAQQSVDSQMPVSPNGMNDGFSQEAWVKERFADRRGSKEAVEGYRSQEDYFERPYPYGLMPSGEGTYSFPLEFEELGASFNEKSYLAVIAIDGNRMGELFQNFGDNFANRYENKDLTISLVNNEYIKAYKKLSLKVDDIFRQAVTNANKVVIEKLEMLNSKGIDLIGNLLPIRPIVVSGDDICVVTDARIGLSYAKILLEQILACSDTNMDCDSFQINLKMYGCAGVAMVHNHYPFFLAHELAEELCSKAKQQIPFLDKTDGNTNRNDGNASYIDFHIVQGELEGSLSDIRSSKYDDSNLTAKPYCVLAENETTPKTWQTFKNRLDEFDQFMKKEIVGRRMLKGYRETLSNDRAEEYLLKVHNGDIIRKDMNRGLDFDVLEVMDMYIELEKEND